MARRRRRSALDRALHHMKPNRVAARFFSGGRHQTFASIAKSPFKEKTVHTPKSGRRAYQQHVARERKARAAEVAKQRKQAAADQKAARAQQRAQQPRQARQRQAPIAVNPRTGKPITWRQAEVGMRQAQREVDRIEAELAGTVKPKRTRAPKAPATPRTPLHAAIDEVKKKQPRKRPTTTPKPAKKPTRKATRRKVHPLTPVLAGTPAPRLQRPRRTLAGVAMAVTCQCQGTGRIIAYKDGAPHGSTSCPIHGRGGKARGSKKWTMRGAIRESGLPGLSGRLQRKRTARRGNSDQRQAKAADITRRETRLAGPTLPCEWCQGGITIPDRKLTEQQRADYISSVLAAVPEGEKPPSKRKLEKLARLAYPHMLCSHCKGLGRVETTATLLPDGRQPVAEWRVGAGLKKGHRLTGRERATGKKKTENARRVDQRRLLR